MAELPFTPSACWFETEPQGTAAWHVSIQQGAGEVEGRLAGWLAAAMSANKDVTSNGHTGLMSAFGMTNNSINLPQHGLAD